METDEEKVAAPVTANPAPAVSKPEKTPVVADRAVPGTQLPPSEARSVI